MKKEMSKIKTLLFMIAASLSTVSIMSDMVIVPSIANIYQVFGDKINLVNYIVSGPALIMVITSLIAAKLMQKVSKKNLIIVGFAIFVVGSVGGILIEDAVYMAVMRTLVGISMGVISVCVMALISEVFVEEAKRSVMMGIYNAAMASVGAVLGIVAGFVASQSWQSVFKVYWISVPILIAMIFWLPQTPTEQEAMDVKEKKEKESIISFNFSMLMVTFIVLNIVYCVVYYQIAIYVAETGIGNEATVGLLSALGTVGSAVCCALFGLIYNKLKHGSLVLSYIGIGVGFTILYFAPSIPFAMVGCTIMGGAYGLGMSCCFMEATIVVPPSRISLSISIASAVLGIGTFSSTYFATILKSIIKTDMLIDIIPVLIVVCIIFIFIEGGIMIKRKRNGLKESN